MHPLIFYAVAGTAIFAAGSGLGHKLTSDHYQAAAAEQERAAAVAYAERTEQLNAVSADLERARHERKVVYKTITQQVDRIVTRDVYRNTCLDSDGLRAINDALAGRASASELADPVPATGAAGGRDGR